MWKISRGPVGKVAPANRDIICSVPNPICEYQNFPGQKWCKSEPSKHEALTQCYFNVGPLSLTSEQHYNNIGSTSRVCWEITEAFIPFSESFINMLCVVTLQRQQPAISKLPAHLIIQWGSVQLWQYHRKSKKTPISMISSETVGARIKNDNVWWNDNIRPNPLKQWLETNCQQTLAHRWPRITMFDQQCINVMTPADTCDTYTGCTTCITQQGIVRQPFI